MALIRKKTGNFLEDFRLGQVFRHKGGRTPRQARMRLFRAPQRPRWTPIVGMVPPGLTHPAWGPFLSILDATDRNTELAER